MQPVMQAALFLQLARFFADILQIIDGGVSTRGKQRAYSGKGKLRFAGVSKVKVGVPRGARETGAFRSDKNGEAARFLLR